MVAPLAREHVADAAQLALQVALGAGAMLTVAAAGGGDGAKLLLPLTTQARAALPALALDGRTSLLGAGLWPGSLVVRRENGVHRPLLAAGIVALPVPGFLCRGAG